MAKLATQTLAFKLSKAVKESADDHIGVIDDESIEQLVEAITALAGDDSIIVECIQSVTPDE